MYCDEMVGRRIEAAEKECGFKLEYNSVSAVQDFQKMMAQRFEEIYSRAYQEATGAPNPTLAYRKILREGLSANLSQDEIRFIINERSLVACDAAYYMTRYYKIKNIQNEIQTFSFNSAQKIYFNIVSQLERISAAIEMMVNKARQLGISTVTEGLISQKVLFCHGVNATIASQDQSKTAEMSNMLFLAYDSLPWWLPPMDTRRVVGAKGMLSFGGQQSAVTFQHGSQSGGISQGTTPTVYHLSEVAYYDDPDQLIEIGLFKAVHPSPKVFGVLESTSAGDEGWWYDTYLYSKKSWPRCRLTAFFLPWFCGVDIYPNPTWIRTNPMLEDFRLEPETRQMRAKAEMYVHSTEILHKVFGANWKLPLQQAWWWQCQFLEARSKGKEKSFIQEYPTTDMDSFQGSYDNVFGKEVIAECFSKRETKYLVYGIVGQSIEDKHEPPEDEIDYSQERVPVKYINRRNGTIYRWELVPMKWEEKFEELTDIRDDYSHMGKFFVWEPPEMGYDYSIGIDTSSGIEQDCSVISVTRRATTPTQPDVQAAEWRSDTVNHVEVFAWAMAIAAFYSRYMGDKPDVPGDKRIIYSEPYVAVEQIAAVGDTVNINMRGMGYSRFHRMGRYDSVPKMMKKKNFTKEGWFTSGWSRPILTSTFVTLVQNGWYIVNSPFTLWEMDHWEVHLTQGGKEKFEHDSNATDDGIFAAALSVFCPQDRKPLAERTTKRYTGDDAPMVTISFVPEPPGMVTMNDNLRRSKEI